MNHNTTLEHLSQRIELEENPSELSTHTKSRNNKKHKTSRSPKCKKAFALTQEDINTQPPKLSKWTQGRVDQICRRFIRKLKQGIVLQTVYDVDSDQNRSDLCFKMFGNAEGFDPNNIWVIVLDVFCLIMRFFLGILYSLDIVFDLSSLSIFFVVEIVGVMLFFIEMGATFAIKIDKDGRRINHVKDIAKQYLLGKFITDLIYFGLILVDLVAPSSRIVSYVRLAAAVYKLVYSFQRVDKLQKISFSSHQVEQVWGIVLVLIVNFTVIHILSLVLNGMAYLNPQQNWWYMKNCQDQAWYVKYAYGAYWGSNIMLTIGFGDITATNWIQAICLVVIEMISCIVLSYNISCLGTLIAELRRNSKQKNNNMRLFNRMYNEQTEGRVSKPTEIKDKVHQFIEGHFQTKKQFNLEDQKSVLSLFPPPLKQQYQNHIYLPVFRFIPVLRKLTTQTMKKVIKKVEKVFVHPDTFIIQKGEKSKLILLSKGEVSFVFKRKSKYTTQNTVIQKVTGTRQFCLISGREVVWDDPSRYSIMSTQFSIIHVIPGDVFRQIVRQNTKDHQNICLIRDQIRYNDMVLSCLECKLCKQGSHTKYQCPLLHYSPLKSIIISKSQSFTYKQNRVFVVRQRSKKWNLMRKSQLSQLPKTQKTFSHTFILGPNNLKKQTRHRRPTVFHESTEEQQIEFDKIHHWNVYLPRDNMTFRKDQDLDSDSD